MDDSTNQGSPGSDVFAVIGNVTSIQAARERRSVEAPLSAEEIRQVRQLLAMGGRIESAVQKAELLSHKCPTARRVFDDLERDGG